MAYGLNSIDRMNELWTAYVANQLADRYKKEWDDYFNSDQYWKDIIADGLSYFNEFPEVYGFYVEEELKSIISYIDSKLKGDTSITQILTEDNNNIKINDDVVYSGTNKYVGTKVNR